METMKMERMMRFLMMKRVEVKLQKRQRTASLKSTNFLR
jgi:hypothetical protein